MNIQRKCMTLAVVEPLDAQRRALQVYFENCDDAELSACCASGRQLFSCLEQGLRPEAVVLDSTCDNVLELADKIHHTFSDYSPLVALTIPSNTLLDDRILLTSGVDCVILKPYGIPGMLKTLYKHCRENQAFREVQWHIVCNQCLGEIGAALSHAGSDYLWKMFREEQYAGTKCTNNALYRCVAKKEQITVSGIRNAVGRLSKKLWSDSAPGYWNMCTRHGMPQDRPLKERELYLCVSADCRRILG